MKQLTFAMCLIALAAAPMGAGGRNTATGLYAEARTAEVFAGGCVINSEAGTAGRQAVLAWKVDRGSYEGVTLDNLSIVAAVTANRNLGIQEIGGAKPDTKSVVYVDQHATPTQQVALLAMARDLSNGIVGAVAQLNPAPIEFTETAHQIHVVAGQAALDVNKHMDHDESCGAMQWFHPLSSVSSPTMGSAERHLFNGAGLGTKWSDPDKKSAFFGTFGN